MNKTGKTNKDKNINRQSHCISSRFVHILYTQPSFLPFFFLSVHSTAHGIKAYETPRLSSDRSINNKSPCISFVLPQFIRSFARFNPLSSRRV